MAAEELQDLPLPALFQRGRTILQQLDIQPDSGRQRQQLVQKGVACLQQAATAADALALFSANEELEDLATADIKYLLIPFYQAEVLAQTQSDNPAERLSALVRAQECYQVFMRQCLQYNLLSPPASALADAALSRDEAGKGAAGARSVDAATLRQQKIEKFKREKYIRSRLEELEARQAGRPGDEDATPGHAAQGVDGEGGEREAWLLQADLAALQAAERVRTLQQEADILRHAASLSPDERQRQREARSHEGPPPDLMRQLAAAAGGLAGGGAAARQRLAAEVFQPSHVLPSMSVEQYGELEYRRMLEQQQQEAAAKERRDREQAERGAEQREEDELREARAWDDFKDDNPRGWGNSKLRPCA